MGEGCLVAMKKRWAVLSAIAAVDLGPCGIKSSAERPILQVMHLFRRQEGYSLIEILVVILIVAVLIAIAVPIFISLRSRADDVAAKDSAVLALKVARSIQEDGTYAGVGLPQLVAAEPSLTFVDGATSSTGPTVVSQEVTGTSVLVVSVFSQAGKCFLVRDEVAVGTELGRIEPATVAECRADNTGAVAFGPDW
jgi:type IV pilus assembly protein PilA